VNTASLWAGRRFRFGRDVKFDVVPMAAVVFGETNGAAPGLEATIAYKRVDWYSESEYVIDVHARDKDFFFMYSELGVRPVRPLRTGLVSQWTRAFESPSEIQRGIFAEYYFKRFRAGIFYFVPFAAGQFWIPSFSVDF
jgi:hypothetical protein